MRERCGKASPVEQEMDDSGDFERYRDVTPCHCGNRYVIGGVSLSMGKNANVNQQQPLSATVNAQTSVTGIGRTGL